MLTTLNFVWKFITVVAVNCVTTPENFVGCMKYETWLTPYIEYYLPYLTGERQPYDTEKEILDNINN